MIVRNFMDHKEQVQIFVEHTVNLVMQRLSEQVRTDSISWLLILLAKKTNSQTQIQMVL